MREEASKLSHFFCSRLYVRKKILSNNLKTNASYLSDCVQVLEDVSSVSFSIAFMWSVARKSFDSFQDTKKAEHAIQSYAAGTGARGPGSKGTHAMNMVRVCNACLELQSQLD